MSDAEVHAKFRMQGSHVVKPFKSWSLEGETLLSNLDTNEIGVYLGKIRLRLRAGMGRNQI